MEYQININETATFTIHANQRYSNEILKVDSGQQYEIWPAPAQYWKDRCIKATPEGYLNPFAFFAGMRKRWTKCFCLCGAFDSDDANAFEIGNKQVKICTDDYAVVSELSFFANDRNGFYHHNKGSIQLFVRRIA